MRLQDLGAYSFQEAPARRGNNGRRREASQEQTLREASLSIAKERPCEFSAPMASLSGFAPPKRPPQRLAAGVEDKSKSADLGVDETKSDEPTQSTSAPATAPAATLGFAPASARAPPAPVAGFAPAQPPAPVAGFGPARPPALAAPPMAAGFAAPRRAPAAPTAVARRGATGARAIPAGRIGGVVPRGPRLADEMVAGGAARRSTAPAAATEPGRCPDCGWRSCQCAHKKVARVVGPPLPPGAQCRICFDGPEDEALCQPCACRGDSGYAHVSCLERWANAAAATKASYECPSCTTRYTGATALRLAVGRVDLELDRETETREGVGIACSNLWVVGMREGVPIDDALLRRYLKKETRRARLPRVAALLAEQAVGRKGRGTLTGADEGMLRENIAEAANTAAEELKRADMRHALAWILAEKAIRVVDAGGPANRASEKTLAADAAEALELARAAHAVGKRILGEKHDDTMRHLRGVGQMHMLVRYLREDSARRAKRESVSERLAHVSC